MNSRFKFEDFEIGFSICLGKGRFGDVYKAIEKNTGKVYAIKRIFYEDYKDNEIDNMLTMMNKSKNSNKYFGFFIKDNLIHLIMELCDCSLDQIITEKKLNAKEIKEILEQLND